MKNYIALALIALAITTAHAQDPPHATEFRKPTPGPRPNGASNPNFLVHRLGNDHAEGITTLDMSGNGFPDILSGVYWTEIPDRKVSTSSATTLYLTDSRADRYFGERHLFPPNHLVVVRNDTPRSVSLNASQYES